MKEGGRERGSRKEGRVRGGKGVSEGRREIEEREGREGRERSRRGRKEMK